MGGGAHRDPPLTEFAATTPVTVLVYICIEHPVYAPQLLIASFSKTLMHILECIVGIGLGHSGIAFSSKNSWRSVQPHGRFTVCHMPPNDIISSLQWMYVFILCRHLASSLQS